MSHQMLSLKTVDELNKVLHLQKTITQRAKVELLAIARDELVPEGDDFTEEQVAGFMEQEQRLLGKYASYPTLTEFAINPKTYDQGKWGATFGVALIVGELVFEQVRHMQPQFGSVLRQMFILLLNELDNPTHEYLVQPLEKSLKFEVTSEDGGEVPSEKQKLYVRSLVQGLIEDFIMVATEYGIVDTTEEGFFITEMGKRVLLHMLDVSKFIEEMLEAHGRFQSSKPKLSVV